MKIDLKEKKMKFAIAVLIIMTSVGCSPQYIRFTQELRDDVKLSDQDLKKLQYYVCPKLLIERSVSSSETKITGGKLIRKSGQLVHQVLVPKWTPGLVIYSIDRYVDVSFEKGTDIAFGVDVGESRGNYRILGTNSNGTFEVTYDGNQYRIVYEESQDCEDYKGNKTRLWIDAESLKKFKKERKVLKGLTLPED